MKDENMHEILKAQEIYLQYRSMCQHSDEYADFFVNF